MKRRDLLTAAGVAAFGGLALGHAMPEVSAMPAHPNAAVARFMAEIPSWGLPAMGSGRLSVVEFFDYHCPYCRAMDPYLPAFWRANPDISWHFAEYPILPPDSAVASRLALAAARQGRYLAAHHWLMRRHGVYSADMAGPLALAIGADPARLRRDMNANPIGVLLDRLQFAGERLHLDGTPAMVTADGVIEGLLPPAGLTALAGALRAGAPVRRS